MEGFLFPYSSSIKNECLFSTLGTTWLKQTRASTRLVINAQFIKDNCKLNLYHTTVTITGSRKLLKSLHYTFYLFHPFWQKLVTWIWFVCGKRLKYILIALQPKGTLDWLIKIVFSGDFISHFQSHYNMHDDGRYPLKIREENHPNHHHKSLLTR